MIYHLWLSLKNKYLLIHNGFVLSQTDRQIENSIFNHLKMFQVSDQKFIDMLNEQRSGRNSFALLVFKYKYSVNSIKNYKPITNEYSSEDVSYINNTSPLIQWRTIIPNSEKKDFLKNIKIMKLTIICFQI